MCVFFVASRTIFDAVVVVVRIVAKFLVRLFHMRNLEPENSSIYQCHAHDIYKLTSVAVEQALGRSHRRLNSLHNQIRCHPRRNLHEELDRSTNFAVLLHNVAPTKNFFSDSHWQQSHNVRWNYIWEKMRPEVKNTRKRPQKRVVSDVVVMVLVLVVSHIHNGLQMARPPAT